MLHMTENDYIKEVKNLVVHCSDTDNDLNIDVLEIHNMHLSFGWDGIGYHKVICRDGEIQNGRPEFWKGAHVFGKNHESLGVCLIGRDKFNTQQYNSLKNLLLEWKKKYPKAEIFGHRDLIKTKKTCPNFDVKLWCKENQL